MSQSSEGKTIPDLYRLLDLEGPESSSTAVQEAVVKLERRVARLKARSDKRASGAEQLLRVASKQFSSLERRAAYDKAWRKQFGQPASTASVRAEQPQTQPTEVGQGDTSQPSTNRRLLELLPQGSPESPFDLAAFLAEPHEAADDEEAALSSIFARMNGQTLPPTALSQPSPPNAPAARIPIQKTSGATLSKKLRKKKQGGLLLPAIGMVGCTAAVLGLIAYLINNPKSDKNLQANGAGNSTAPLTPNKPNQVAKPKGSGLPQVSGLGTGAGDLTTPPMQEAGFPTGQNPQGTLPNRPTMGNSPSAGMASTPAMSDAGMNNGLPSAAGKPENSDSQPPKTAAETEVPSLSADELQAFRTKCQEVIRVLGEYRYQDANNEIDALLNSPLPKPERAQANRLRALAQYAKQGHEGLQRAIQQLGPGEVFTVGKSTQVAFVEGSDQHIVLRLGNQKTYDYATLPPGVLYSLLDMSLDRENQTALAQRAAFIMFQPNRNQRTLEYSQSLLTQAIVASKVPADLVEVFSDPWFKQ